MKSSGIGGQAVIEGIMMRNKDKYAIAIRKPDQQIEVEVRESSLLTEKYKWLNYPVIRGIFNFLDSLITGVSIINYSASFYDDPSEQKKTKLDEVGKAVFKDKLESVLMAVTIVFSIALAVALFMLLPFYISRIFAKYITSQFLLNFIEGIIKVIIFILYIAAISKMNDIKRTFMYHGAEHKCINCIENGAKLTPINVKNSSRYHRRCGTSFLFFVVFLSVLFFIFIRVDNTLLQVVIRLLLVPVIAGVSYEIIRWAGNNNNKLENIISKPGVWLQRLTTKEPDMDMIEVAIQAVNAVFDSDAYLAEYYKDSENPEAEMEAKAAELALSSNLIIDESKKSRSLNPDDIPEELKTRVHNDDDDPLAHIDFEEVIELDDDMPQNKADDISDSAHNNSLDEQEDLNHKQENASAVDELIATEENVVESEDQRKNDQNDDQSMEESSSKDQDSNHQKSEDETSEDQTSGDQKSDDENMSDDDIIFEDDTFEEDDTCADDVPIFKQKETDN